MQLELVRHDTFGGHQATIQQVNSDRIGVRAQMRSPDIDLLAITDDRPVGGGFVTKYAEFDEAAQFADDL